MSIRIPAYINRNFENDFSGFNKTYGVRVAAAALPFFSLYKPFSYPLSLAMGAVRLLTTGKTETPLQVFSVAAAIAGIAGTYFRHPLGMLIATAHDLVFDLGRLVSALQAGEYQSGMIELLQVINNTLYMGLFVGGGAQVLAASLSIQFLVGIHRSYAHFQKGGERLEGVSHLLMALIRGHQAIRGWQSICIEQDMRQAKEEGKPYLPIANRIQKFFVNAGYRINGLSRWTVRQIGHHSQSRVQTAAKVALAVPIALAAFLISTPCYLAASYAGTGRFERIEAATPSHFAPNDDKVKVMFQNICGQDPWSIFSGGVVPPLEIGPNGESRADSIISKILEGKPDIYCGQEFDDLGVSGKIGHVLSQEGYTCIRDLGCNDPLLNHSGLFIAIRGPIESVAFHSFAPEHASGITSWCNRGVLELTTPLFKVVNVHLNSGGDSDDQTSRLLQLKNYVSPLMGERPTLVVGDSNLDTSALSDEERKMGGLLGTVNALEGEITCSDEGKHNLNGKSRDGCDGCEERIDVALFNPDLMTVSDLQIQPGDSDHHLISLSVAQANR